MLTRLRFKNWRSLKDVEIDDLQPINVFIGANSSGKTNIVDALRFWRDCLNEGMQDTVLKLEYYRIQTDAVNLEDNNPVKFAYTFDLNQLISEPITQEIELEFQKRTIPFIYTERLFNNNKMLYERSRELPIRDTIEVSSTYITSEERENEKKGREIRALSDAIITRRWQILGENFSPPIRLSRRQSGDAYVIEPDTSNTLLMLGAMELISKDIYKKLETDLVWLLNHVQSFDVRQQRLSDDLELNIHERERPLAETVSSGTARTLAMLTAIYALDLPQEYSVRGERHILRPTDPGLVVIEEPDTALNPGILQKFVELLRSYTTREGYPRQFILTTHNPAFLDYFRPEEVRIVERDTNGYTTVRKVPDHIRDIWLQDHTLGEVWLTRVMGGMPE